MSPSACSTLRYAQYRQDHRPEQSRGIKSNPSKNQLFWSVEPADVNLSLPGGGNRANVKYPSRRLIAEGFKFPLGVTGAVRKVMQDRRKAQ